MAVYEDGAESTLQGPLDALIVGAGFSGMYQLYSLRDRLGLSVRVLEAAEDVGGTWYWNRYPGARCDSESHSYCYYFSDELLTEWEWSERYPEQPEIMRYLNFVADRLDLRRDIQFRTRVTSAAYDEARNLWVVETSNGEHFETIYLITAVGCLSSANIPAIPGLSTFEGDWHHTGHWPHEGVDFTGKRVGQIGTGSTGIQAAPVIAAQAAHLTVFQRTANYSVPARNAPLDPEFKRYIKENRNEIRELIQSTPNGHPFRISDIKVFDVSDEERQAIYEAAWKKGGLQFRASFQDLLINAEANETASAFLKEKIRRIVKDPQMAEALAAIDHPYAAKRPPIDTGYFETFNRENVSLVDLRKEPIEAITPKGVRTTAGEYELDIIVFATGFDAMTGPFLSIDICGRGGVLLKDAWRDGPETYLGLQVSGFPNMFTITGPGSPSVLCNMPPAIEQHVEWITNCIAYMREHDFTTIEASSSAQKAWVQHVNETADLTLLPRVAHSWYLGANVPGKPRVFMPYAGGLQRYRTICEDIAAMDYEGFALTSSDPSSRKEHKSSIGRLSIRMAADSPGV